MANGDQLTPQEFAAKIKAKYPVYAKIPDDQLVQKILAKYPQYASKIKQTPSTYERLTAPFDPGAQNPLTRFLSSAGGSLIGAPGAVYHTFADEPTPEEAQMFEGHTRIPGELALERMTSIPLVKAYQGYKELHPSVRAILSVLPEALGGGVGTVAAGELGGEAGKLGAKAIGKIPGVQPSLQEAVVGKAEVEEARLAHEAKAADKLREHAEKVDAIRKENEGKLQLARSEHEAELSKIDEEYNEKVQKVGRKTAEDEAAYQLKKEHAKDAYAKKLAEHQQKLHEASAKLSASEVAEKTLRTGAPRGGPVYQRLAGMADKIANNIPVLERAVRQVYGARWNAWRQAIGPIEGDFTPVMEAVEHAEDSILKGSPENIAIFRNILKEGEDPILADASVFKGKGAGIDVKDIIGSRFMSEATRNRVLRSLEESGVDTETGRPPLEQTDLPLEDMRGYIEELQQKLYSGKMPSGDIYRALKYVKEAAETAVEETIKAKDPKQLPVYMRLKADWSQMLEDFRDQTGALYKLSKSINPDTRLNFLKSAEGARVIDALQRYQRFLSKGSVTGSDLIDLSGWVRSLISELRKAESAKIPKAPERPTLPARPSPREMPKPPKGPESVTLGLKEMPKRPETEPFSSAKYRREHIQKVAENLSHITGWDVASIGYAIRELFSGETPWALGYPVGKRVLSKLLTMPGVVEYLSKEL